MRAPSFYTARRKGAKVSFTGERKMSSEDKPVKEYLNPEDEASLKAILARHRANGLEIDEQFLRSQINSEVLDQLEGKVTMDIKNGDVNAKQQSESVEQTAPVEVSDKPKTTKGVIPEMTTNPSESAVDEKSKSEPEAKADVETEVETPSEPKKFETYAELKLAAKERVEVIVRTIDTVFQTAEVGAGALPALDLSAQLIVRGIVPEKLTAGISSPILKAALVNYPESQVEKFITSAMDIIRGSTDREDVSDRLTTHCNGLLIDLLDVDVDPLAVAGQDTEFTKAALKIFGVSQHYSEMFAA